MKYGCIAEKLSHSFSKEIHAHLADYPYELREVAKEELDSFMRARDFLAINVTIPYKQSVIPYLDEVSEIARKIGAVNTIVNKNGKLFGYNTDFFGMRELILRAGIEVLGKKALVLGSGGTSKTAEAVLYDLGAARVLRVSRSATEELIDYETAKSEHCDAEIIVNTTPVGMYPNIDSSPIELDAFSNLCAVVDAVYNPLRTKLVLDAERRGIRATGGLYMLVAQAARACEFFIDKEIAKEKIEEVFQKIYKNAENIVLVGMPGSGKSTVGKLIATDLSREFFDSDEEIVKSENKDIPDIFREGGEKVFRDIESREILKLSALKNAVIATGGGAVLREENIDRLRRNGRIYFIDRPIEQIVPTSDRPLSRDREALEKRFLERYPIYCAVSDVHVKSDGVANGVARQIEEDFLK